MSKDDIELAPLSSQANHDSETGNVVNMHMNFWQKLKRSPFISSTANLANTTIGAGVLGLPFVLAQCGIVLGLFLVCVCALAATFTMKMLLQAAHYTDIKLPSVSYETVGMKAFGKRGHVVATMSILLLNFGACCAFLVIAGDQIVPIIRSLNLGFLSSSRAVWIIGTVLVIVLPLSLLGNIHSLRHTSILAIVGVLVFTITVVIEVINDHSLQSLSLKWVDFNGVLRSLPVVVFAFACQTGLLPIYSELGDKTDEPFKLMNRVISTSVSVSFTVYCIVAVGGYVTFRSLTRGDLLLNYASELWLNFVRFVLYLVVVFSYPLASFPLRKSILETVSLFRGHKMKNWEQLDSESLELEPELELDQDQDGHSIPHPDDRTHGVKSRVLVTLGIVFLSTLISILAEDVVVVFGLTGATACTFTTFLLPTTFQFRLSYLNLRASAASTTESNADKGKAQERTRKIEWNRRNVVSVIVGALGLAGGIGSTIALIAEL